MTAPSAHDWFYAQGALERDGWETVVDQAISGWRYTGIRVAALAAGDSRALPAEAVERIVVPLAGSFMVRYTLAGETEERSQALAGRASVFHGPTDTLYLPTGTALAIDGAGRVAVAEAPTDTALPVAYIPRADVPIELRGAGRSSRQVHNFGTPASVAADRLIVCEVITPAENWSSYPPHKHDEYSPGVESSLEEIYYFETAVTRGQAAPETARPFGLMRTYSSDAGAIDINAEVHTGDVALVPFGWHGPCVAAPGYDLYYLNVMAGPDPDRTWNISDDPAHGWIRDTWLGQEFDSRLPYTS
ncbi:5-deoxyglucuronate isomerase [Cryobacterium roopkundense]|uniref:5-deoxy-glucuronate isomerase n=1 Tax=Cryobacterium roopkundense TaxID=1001240 RepID=A0A099JAE2_9MICO|nr:5-deoxy-glucuronate isomerase [Cryobacterium roopkundense]KGJ74463.1 5-deoxyglucuronate isomerase [Cryobacterium roopkundense]MBB5643423.1 5-deoxy-glucuronate isomerase [Cryobacterium roopkundense]